MMRKTLIITNTAGFGVLIQQTLEDTGRYSVNLISFANLTTTPEKADVIILDLDYGTAEGEPLERFASLAVSLQFAYPEAVYILVPPLNNFNHPIVDRLKPTGMLTKPFYLPELVEMVDGLLKKTEEPKEVEAEAASVVRVVRNNHPEPPAWLQDVSRAAQYLARLSLESSAQAALIVRGDVLWAYAGEMTQPEVQELTRIVISYRASQTKPLSASQRNTRSDLARYSRLPTSGKEVMVYVTALAEGLQLVLAYDAATPFSMIRMQANHLARVLATSPDGIETSVPAGQNNADLQAAVQQAAGHQNAEQPTARWDSVLAAESLMDRYPPASEPASFELREEPQVISPSRETPPEQMDIVTSLPLGALPLIDNIPPFSPRQESVSNLEGDQEKAYTLPAQPVTPSATQSTTWTTAQISPQPTRPEMNFSPLERFEAAALIDPDGSTPVYENLAYACMLTPRMPNHYLTGDLGFRLGEMLPQLCLAYGWRLEQLTIHMDHILWAVRASANTPPGRLIRVARQYTSTIIFDDFPSLARENPSGDFWAPGHLILSSASLSRSTIATTGSPGSSMRSTPRTCR